jgi:hypothetical protein
MGPFVVYGAFKKRPTSQKLLEAEVRLWDSFAKYESHACVFGADLFVLIHSNVGHRTQKFSFWHNRFFFLTFIVPPVYYRL